MELKSRCCTSHHADHHVLIVPLWNWNPLERRRSEQNLSVLIVPLWNWNKVIKTESDCVQYVLIVPLWNWNDGFADRLCWEDGSNCTFMELKCGRGRREKKGTRSSNCTFMELKYTNTLKSCIESGLVLIVPLWNWNVFVHAAENRTADKF